MFDKKVIISTIIGVLAVGAIFFVIRKLPANTVTNAIKTGADALKG